MLIIAGIIGALIYFNAPSMRNLYIKEAEFWSESELDGLYADKEYFVTTFTDDFFDTDYYMTEDGKTKDKYYTFFAGDRYILCKTGVDFTEYEYEDFTVSGYLRKLTSTDSEVISGIADDISYDGEISYEEALDYFAPYIINMKASRTVQQVFVGIGLLAVLAAVLRICFSVYTMSDYTRSKKYKKLDNGGVGSAERVNSSISAEFERGEFRINKPYMKMSANWMAFTKFSDFSVYRKSDMLWVYKTITRHRTNGIPTGKTYTVTLRFADKQTETIPAKNERVADEIVQTIITNCPGAVAGYSKELESQYNSNAEPFVKFGAE
jgi:hypothetical protein